MLPPPSSETSSLPTAVSGRAYTPPSEAVIENLRTKAAVAAEADGTYGPSGAPAVQTLEAAPGRLQAGPGYPEVGRQGLQQGPPKTPQQNKGGAPDPRAEVGGKVIFQVGLVNAKGTDIDPSTKMVIRLAPARRSYLEKQGQQVPGAGAGLEATERANLAKLNVPGSRPIYQHMGVAEEMLEWVGAFLGEDHDDDVFDDEGMEPGMTADRESQELIALYRKGQECMLKLEWDDFGIFFAQSTKEKGKGRIHYKGYFKLIRRVFGHAHRVYYQVQFVVTNRDDLLTGKDNPGAAVPLPQQLKVPVGKVRQAQVAVADGKVDNAGSTNAIPATTGVPEAARKLWFDTWQAAMDAAKHGQKVAVVGNLSTFPGVTGTSDGSYVGGLSYARPHLAAATDGLNLLGSYRSKWPDLEADPVANSQYSQLANEIESLEDRIKTSTDTPLKLIGKAAWQGGKTVAGAVGLGVAGAAGASAPLAGDPEAYKKAREFLKNAE